MSSARKESVSITRLEVRSRASGVGSRECRGAGTCVAVSVVGWYRTYDNGGGVVLSQELVVEPAGARGERRARRRGAGAAVARPLRAAPPARARAAAAAPPALPVSTRLPTYLPSHPTFQHGGQPRHATTYDVRTTMNVASTLLVP